MSPIIHCPGHEFEARTVEERLRGKAPFECKHCHLKLNTHEAVSALTGRSC